MANKKFVFITFDVEEFDMPLEYGHQVSSAEQMQVGFDGLNAIQPLLRKEFMQCTLFTTANFALHFPSEIKQLSQQQEIASHTYYHSNFEIEHLIESKETLEKICNKTVQGLRMPRLKKIDTQDILNAGYVYDSSINPTYLPGRYNNLNLPKIIYKDANLIKVPTAVTPNLRIPLFWLMFKNAPYHLFKFWCYQALKKYGYLSLYFHPWEFVDISKFNIPSYTKKPCGEILLSKLEKLIADFKSDNIEFVSIENYINNYEKII